MATNFCPCTNSSKTIYAKQLQCVIPKSFKSSTATLTHYYLTENGMSSVEKMTIHDYVQYAMTKNIYVLTTL